MAKSRKQIIDLHGMSKSEVKKLVKAEGYSDSTFYKAWKRKTLTVTVVRKRKK